MNVIRFVLAAAVAAVCATPSPAGAAGTPRSDVMGSAPERDAPAPRKVRIERDVALVANLLRYVEQHLRVEVASDAVERPLSPTPASGLAPQPAVAGTFALGGGGSATVARLSTVLSASHDRLRLTLRLRW